ncbi:hypothetical protein AMTR_s00099p00154370 [Amborella trichopoda]|uniref:Uncharacterized protein n=1 Tax=Amborella trichopoda TaxID=13333 RepID=W1NWU0_AMBTC|nr:hypothetical protein AMTR_s00099p00154370 [Amborella trichopoda]
MQLTTEPPLQDELRNPGLEKELEKQIRKRDGTDDKKQCHGVDRDGDDSHLSSKDDQEKVRHRVDRHKDRRYPEKCREDFGKEHRHRSDKKRERASPRDHSIDRWDDNHSRHERRLSEGRFKTNKSHGSDQESSPPADDRRTRSKDNREKSRSSYDYGAHGASKHGVSEFSDAFPGKELLDNSKLEKMSDKEQLKSDNFISNALDLTSNNTHPEGSSCREPDLGIGQNRLKPMQVEPSHEGFSAERIEPASRVSSSKGNPYVSESPTGECDSRAKNDKPHERNELSNNSAIYLHEARGALVMSPCTSSKSNTPASPIKGSPAMSQINFERMDTKSQDGTSEMNGYVKPAVILGSPSIREKLKGPDLDEPERTTLQSNRSPESSVRLHNPPLLVQSSSILLSPPPNRQGNDSFMALGSSSGFLEEKKHIFRNKRGDLGGGRFQTNGWKGVMQSWNAQSQGLVMHSGFMPFQHQVPPIFHPVMQPMPPLFGMRPDGFPGNFGWQMPQDDSCLPLVQTQLNSWDGVDKSWDQKRHLMNQAWDMSGEIWNGQSEGVNLGLGFPGNSSPFDACPAQPTNCGRQEKRSRPERSTAESIEVKRSEVVPTKPVEEAPHREDQRVLPDSKKLSCDKTCFYLSKLDISVDLAGLELYRECASLLSSLGGIDAVHSADAECLSLGTSVGDLKVTPKPRTESYIHHLKQPFLRQMSDDIFQRAMALYSKQAEKTKAKISAISYESHERRLQIDNNQSGNKKGNQCIMHGTGQELQKQNPSDNKMQRSHCLRGSIEKPEVSLIYDTEVFTVNAQPAILDEGSRTPFEGCNSHTSLVSLDGPSQGDVFTFEGHNSITKLELGGHSEGCVSITKLAGGEGDNGYHSLTKVGCHSLNNPVNGEESDSDSNKVVQKEGEVRACNVDESSLDEGVPSYRKHETLNSEGVNIEGGEYPEDCRVHLSRIPGRTH